MEANPRLLHDPDAIDLGSALIIAKQQAAKLGFNHINHEVRTREATGESGERFIRVDFLPPRAPNVYSRGGGFMVEVNTEDGSVRRALFGQ